MLKGRGKGEKGRGACKHEKRIASATGLEKKGRKPTTSGQEKEGGRGLCGEGGGGPASSYPSEIWEKR